MNFVKKKIINILRTYHFTKPNNPRRQNNKYKKSLHILEDAASGVQVRDIEQVIV